MPAKEIVHNSDDCFLAIIINLKTVTKKFNYLIKKLRYFQG